MSRYKIFFIVIGFVGLEGHVKADVDDTLYGEPAAVAVLDLGIHVDVAQVVEREQVLSLHVDADVLDAGFRSPGFGQRVTDLDVLQADVRSVVEEEARILLFIVVVDAVVQGGVFRRSCRFAGRPKRQLRQLPPCTTASTTRRASLLRRFDIRLKNGRDRFPRCPKPGLRSRHRIRAG